jgi:Putative transposase/Transposase zinc-binding domain
VLAPRAVLRVCASTGEDVRSRNAPSYARRRPEASALFEVVRANLLTLYAAIEQGFAAPLPKFVRDELEGYVGCGVLARGFALFACPECGERKLVAFSCGGRGFCPSCWGRRMAQGAANLVDHVLPERVPLRQFVLTVPFELRARLAYDRALAGGVGRVFIDTVLRWYARTLRARGVARGQSGAVTVVQRVSSDLRLQPHYHAILLDGVFAPDGDGTLRFHPLPPLSTPQVTDLMQAVVARVVRWLVRHGVVEDADDLAAVDSDFAEREPALAALASASVSGVLPAGPERRERVPVALVAAPGVQVKAPLSVVELGFSLHAATVVGAGDRAGREGLCKYVLRPPVAQERVELLPDGLVRLHLKRQFSDGTVAVDLDPLSLLCRLASSVPPPKMHLVRYAGVLAAAHKWRPRVVPPRPDSDDTASDSAHAHEKSDKPATHRSGYWPWARLLKRSLGLDADRCDACGAKMRLRALVVRAESIARFLTKLGEPTEPPKLSPARGPPYFATRALRRKLGELGAVPAQMEMFGA